jgi:hypothetical protein
MDNIHSKWRSTNGLQIVDFKTRQNFGEAQHAQPKKSATPIFRRMLASHERSLIAARGHNEPAGQIASRELEIVRIRGALQRAEELSDDVAAAIEGSVG